jgi:hypothetical protein
MIGNKEAELALNVPIFCAAVCRCLKVYILYWTAEGQTKKFRYFCSAYVHSSNISEKFKQYALQERNYLTFHYYYFHQAMGFICKIKYLPPVEYDPVTTTLTFIRVIYDKG